jgi:polar amino acid transport system substrate-binding protein
MSIFVRRAMIGPIAALLLLAACQSNASPSASTAASQAASAAASAAASVAATPVATVPSNQLNLAGKLIVCSDIPYPPQEFFDANQQPTGSDIDIGAEIAKRLGLTLQVENSVFDTIIAAVTGGKCDIIISAQNINADRVKQVDMIPYFEAGQSFMVPKGNPKGIKVLDDLCGTQIGAESGTTEAFYIGGTDQYKGDGLTKECADKGKPAPILKQYQKDSDTILALQSSAIDVYFGDTPVVVNYVGTNPAQFELSTVPPLPGIKEGISVPKDKTGLRDAVVTALKSMMDDGAYLQILKKYSVDTGALQSSDVVPVTK